jgi:hypothetical protein
VTTVEARQAAAELLARVPADAALPVPKGDREKYAVPQELQGMTREELVAFVERDELPFL